MWASWLGRAGLVAAVLLSAAGCAGKKRVPTSGVVRMDGRPVENAVAQFYPEAEEAEPARGVTGADGAFQLETNRAAGAAPGAYRVVVVKFDTSPPAGAATGGKAKRNVLPPEYGSWETTPLRCTVPHDGPVLLDLHDRPTR
jgi:hypothetical protein